MGLEVALAWETCTFGLTKKLPCPDSSFSKLTIELSWAAEPGGCSPLPPLFPANAM